MIMGLFDDLKKSAADFGAAVKTAAQSQEAQEFKGDMKSAFGNLGKMAKSVGNNGNAQPVQQPSGYRAAVAPNATVAAAQATSVSVETKICNVLAGQFPQYTVIKNLSPSAIGGVGRFMNYTIAVYEGTVPKLFIMVIGKHTTAHREYRWSKEQAARACVPMINFIEHYPNEIGYIVNRLRQYL